MPTPVLLLVRSLSAGGSERQMTELAKGLLGSGWEPHVGCFNDQGGRGDELRTARLPIVRFPVHSFASTAALWGARMLGQYIHRHRIRIVHSFDMPMNIFGVLAARFYQCPVVLSSQRAHRTLNLPWERRLLRVTDRLVDGIVVNCEALRRHLVEDEQVPPRLIHVCYNSVDKRIFYPLTQPRPPAVAGATLVIGCVCVLRPEKGLATLLDAFALVRSLRPGLKLVLVGSGPMLEALQEQAGRLCIADAVHFEPNTFQVAEWMRAIDIFVLPSLSEALSNSLMEAMLCGCAAVVSRVGGNPEIVMDGQTGLTFDAGDADGLASCLRRLIEEDDFRHRLAVQGGRSVSERFDPQHSIERMEDVYRSALQARGG